MHVVYSPLLYELCHVLTLWNKCRAIYHYYLTFIIIRIIINIFCAKSALAYVRCIIIVPQPKQTAYRFRIAKTAHRMPKRRFCAKSIFIYALHPFSDVGG